MTKKEDKCVAFNVEQQKLYQKLKAKGYISKPFHLFVRSIFYDKINELNKQAMAK